MGCGVRGVIGSAGGRERGGVGGGGGEDGEEVVVVLVVVVGGVWGGGGGEAVVHSQPIVERGRGRGSMVVELDSDRGDGCG